MIGAKTVVYALKAALNERFLKIGLTQAFHTVWVDWEQSFFAEGKGLF